ncbi:MAG: TrmB family transcriptional regulator [Patescibacteria group bacterium]
MRNIIPKLRSLGFLESEIKTYLAALEEGPSTVLELNKKINISRQAIYTAIESLVKQGLMTSVEKGKKTLYAAESPNRLLDIAENKLKTMQSTVKDIKSIAQELSLMESGEKPVVKMYEGVEGYLALVEEVAHERPTEVLEIANEDIVEKAFSEETKKTVREKFDKLKMQGKLLSKTSDLHPIRSQSKSRIITRKDIDFEGAIAVMNDMLILQTYSGKMIGILIKNKIIADTAKAMFKLAWDNEKK